MTYADSGQGFRDEPRYRGEPGFREEADFRSNGGSTTPYSTGGYPGDDYSMRMSDTSPGLFRRPVSAAELDDVFDDSGQGGPGMDRMAVHMIWEVLLLLGCIGLFLLFRQTHRSGVSGSALHALLLSAASLGFITIGMALSLRAAAVNLAVGPIAAASAFFFASHSDRNLPATVGVTVLLAMAVGAVIAVLAVGFHVPAWAASLAAAFAVIVWIQKHNHSATDVATYHPAKQAYYWYGAFAALSLLGGVLGLVRPIRRAVGKFRPIGDPARRRGGGAGTMAFVAIVASSALAAFGGVLLGLSSLTVAPTDGLVTTGFALGVALVGGTSVYGRRGGIFGTLLAVTLFVLLTRYGDAANWRVAQLAWAAGVIAAGLIVSRLVEAFGRSQGVAFEEEGGSWAGDTHAINSSADPANWSNAPRQGGWSSQLPARSLDDTWAGDERWGNR
jgi:ribose/xylose/arabinose/galactoside ABC-type transport system permease subunit